MSLPVNPEGPYPNPSTLVSPSAERNIYGRWGRLFIQEIDTNEFSKNNSLGKFQWLANVTDIKASLVIEKTEVRSAGEKITRYKAGGQTGTGTLTFDKVNSYFEGFFLDNVNAAKGSGRNIEAPRFFITISLEDRGLFGQLDSDGQTYHYGTNTQYNGTPSSPLQNQFSAGREPGRSPNLDSYGFATQGHEQIILQSCQFWDLPLGYDTTSMISQNMTFTFSDAVFGAGDGPGDLRLRDTSNYKFPLRIC